MLTTQPLTRMLTTVGKLILVSLTSMIIYENGQARGAHKCTSELCKCGK
jgi:hypothetical protein